RLAAPGGRRPRPGTAAGAGRHRRRPAGRRPPRAFRAPPGTSPAHSNFMSAALGQMTRRPPRCANALDAINWRMDHMSHVRRFDHVGITVADLDAVTAFFVALGLEVEGRMFIEGEFVDTVIGIPNSRSEILMLRPPDGGTRLELSSFVRPDHLPGSPAAPANELGLRNVAFEVTDIQAAVDRVAKDGFGLVGGIGEYEGVWKMAYVRGPEGIIVSLAQRIG